MSQNIYELMSDEGKEHCRRVDKVYGIFLLNVLVIFITFFYVPSSSSFLFLFPCYSSLSFSSELTQSYFILFFLSLVLFILSLSFLLLTTFPVSGIWIPCFPSDQIYNINIYCFILSSLPLSSHFLSHHSIIFSTPTFSSLMFFNSTLLFLSSTPSSSCFSNMYPLFFPFSLPLYFPLLISFLISIIFVGVGYRERIWSSDWYLYLRLPSRSGTPLPFLLSYLTLSYLLHVFPCRFHLIPLFLLSQLFIFLPKPYITIRLVFAITTFISYPSLSNHIISHNLILIISPFFLKVFKEDAKKTKLPEFKPAIALLNGMTPRRRSHSSSRRSFMGSCACSCMCMCVCMCAWWWLVWMYCISFTVLLPSLAYPSYAQFNFTFFSLSSHHFRIIFQLHFLSDLTLFFTTFNHSAYYLIRFSLRSVLWWQTHIYYFLQNLVVFTLISWIWFFFMLVPEQAGDMDNSTNGRSRPNQVRVYVSVSVCLDTCILLSSEHQLNFKFVYNWTFIYSCSTLFIWFLLRISPIRYFSLKYSIPFHSISIIAISPKHFSLIFTAFFIYLNLLISTSFSGRDYFCSDECDWGYGRVVPRSAHWPSTSHRRCVLCVYVCV